MHVFDTPICGGTEIDHIYIRDKSYGGTDKMAVRAMLYIKNIVYLNI